ncbi:acetyl-CoA synthetase-like protein [Obba rivulosa]|uniref:Acetyl-CoA synthetase-like protein n=1 Tax=Obba rivulosa TaxID=1052685 RepID=A0A8E2DTZ1_9APHY|nr:acetyl-CoA synthetase-like protein [Obba rivulosa]
MPATYRTHLTVLQEVASLHPTATAFRVPQLEPTTQRILEWDAISFAQFHSDVEHFARYWGALLQARGIALRSVVGVWIGGMTYVDVLHIYAIVRAGYIPQLFSLRLPSPDVIFELLAKSDGKALIYDISYEGLVSSSPVPTHAAIDARACAVSDIPLPPLQPLVDGSDTVMIFHTSGSTSGSPKLIPSTYAWWDHAITKGWQVMKPKKHRNNERQDVTVWMGSMCHIGQTFMFVGTIQHASCTVQYTKQAFSSEELLDMIDRCGLTRINQFPTFLAIHLRESRYNPKLLEKLQQLDEIFISGLMLTPEDEQWVHNNGIRITNCYGSTEGTAMMLSDDDDRIGDIRPLRPIPGTQYRFVPVTSSEDEDEYRNPHMQLRELVVLSSSPDCPHPSLRRKDDGHYHTGDLFLELAPGKFVFRGRDDDWIKTENSLRCDTKAIEDNVRTTCADLVDDCIVVGNSRPSPALFVEPKGTISPETLKKEIIRRTRHFHSRRYMHERIVSPDFIVVVPPRTLPRTSTKGNIRRRAVEESFRTQLDQIYGVQH